MLYLQDVEKNSITRNVLPQTNGQQEIELHGLSDASLQSYDACIYLRKVSKSGVPSFKVKTHSDKKYDNTDLLENILLNRLMASVQKTRSKVIHISK